MVKKRKFRRHIFFILLTLLLLVFIAGLLLGRNLSNEKLDEITMFIKNSELNTESYLIEQELIGTGDKNNCELSKVRVDDISSQLVLLGRKLTADDTKESIDTTKYSFLKLKYHLMQIKTYLLFYNLAQECDMKSPIILYFYGDDGGLSQQQGYILDKIVEDYNTKVFAIEYNYSKELSFLESYYKIKTTPSIIINYDKLIEGPADYETIKNEIETQSGKN